jgi:hypothetical protein
MSTALPENLVNAYWLPEVGIGPETPAPGVMPGKQIVQVPLSELLNYKNPDGSPQINVINLFGTTFTNPSDFSTGNYLNFDSNLLKELNSGIVPQLQAAGINVVLTIVGTGGTSVGWSTIPENEIQGFVNYLDQKFLNGGFNLNGIDIDDEYAARASYDTLTETVKAMYKTFNQDKIISKALFDDIPKVKEIKEYLTFGATMAYGNYFNSFVQNYQQYRDLGFTNEQLLIGVNAGPVAQGGSFTSIEVVKEVTQWQPNDGQKRGMMVWSFSQDIQQFTANPQNQIVLKYPNRNDHEWQKTIVANMPK